MMKAMGSYAARNLSVIATIITVLSLWNTLLPVDAFVVPPTLLLLARQSTSIRSISIPRQPQQQIKHDRLPQSQVISSSTSLSSSVDDSDDLFKDDELSKLIGKRNQIKRKRKPSTDTTSEDDDDTSLAVPLDKINLDQMPAFQTPRPVRRPRRDDDDNDDEGGSGSKGSSSKKGSDVDSSNSLYLDYLADYSDENELHIPNRIGFSTRAWGDPALGFTTVATGKKLSKTDLRFGKFVAGDVQVAYNQLLQNGIVLGDTSELYGASLRSSQLSAEHIFAQCIQDNPNGTPLVSTSMMSALKLRNILQTGTLRWPYSSKAIVKALTNSCQRLELAAVELYQVPNLYLGSSSIVARGLAQAVENGLCSYVGVQNAGRRGMKSLRQQLDKQEVQLTSNTMEFSLTNRKAWKSGLIDACKDMGVIPLIQYPLDRNDLASGRYTATNPSGGQATAIQRFNFNLLEKLQPLHNVQETVAERVRTRVLREIGDTQVRSRGRYGPPPKINTDITTTQVAINYVVAKGGVPLVSVNTPKDAQEVLGCLGWSLTEDDVEMLDAAASLCGL